MSLLRKAKPEARLLASDRQGSILGNQNAHIENRISYTPFGYLPLSPAPSPLLAFCAYPREKINGYLLGNGYRLYMPQLMRFNSPDNFSPFGQGGINAYAYPLDPINNVDPTGHVGRPLQKFNSGWKFNDGVLYRVKKNGGGSTLTPASPLTYSEREIYVSGISETNKLLALTNHLEKKLGEVSAQQEDTQRQVKRNKNSLAQLTYDPSDYTDKKRVNTMKNRLLNDIDEGESRLRHIDNNHGDELSELHKLRRNKADLENDIKIAYYIRNYFH